MAGWRSRLGAGRERIDAVLRSHRSAALRIALVAVVAGAAEAIALVIIALVAVAASGGEEVIDSRLGFDLDLGPALGVAALLLVLRLVLAVLSARLTASLGAEAQETARRRLLHSYLRAEWSLQAKEERGRLQELISVNADNDAAMTMSAVTAFTAALTLGVLLVAALIASPAAAAFVLVVGVVLVVFLQPVVRRMRRLAQANVASGQHLATGVAEAVAATREARAFGVVDRLEAEVDEQIGRAAETFRAARFAGLVTPAVVHTSVMLFMVAVLGAVVAVSEGERLASIGAAALVLVRSISYGQQVNVAAHRLAELAPNQAVVDQQVAAYKEERFDPGTVDIDSIERVGFESVSYEYLPGRLVLDDVSLQVERGEVVGIVGPSGGGKSTLVQVLLRLRRPLLGRIVCDGVDLGEVRWDRWAALVGFVPQDPTIFRGTVAHNVAFWRDLEPAAVIDAARRAHLDDDLAALPEGYQTELGGSGVSLSGGQIQRLALARALAGRPQLLVLDEPTSALDAASELRVRTSLADLRPELATVVIAHRPATIELCDRVLVLEGGHLRSAASATEARAMVAGQGAGSSADGGVV